MFERINNADFVNGYVFFKMMIGFYLWHITVKQFECGSQIGALVPGVFAICFIMEGIRLLREKYFRKR